MEAMRQTWTDDRLDALNEKVDRRFDEVDRRFDEVDRSFVELGRRLGEVDRRLEGVEGLRGEIKSVYEQMNARFDSLQRMMLQASVAVIVGLFGVLVSVIW